MFIVSVQLFAKAPRAYADEDRSEHKERDEVWVEHIETHALHSTREHGEVFDRIEISQWLHPIRHRFDRRRRLVSGAKYDVAFGVQA